MTTSTARPRAATLALLLACATAAAWIAKDVAIVSAGGLGRSPAEGPLFLLGLALSMATAVALGLAAAGLRTRSRAWGAVGVLAVLLAVGLVGTVVQLVAVAARPAHPGWVWAELNLWAVAATLVGASLVVRTRTSRRVSEPATGRSTAVAAT